MKIINSTMDIFLELESGMTVIYISKKTDITYSHMIKLINFYVFKKLIKSEKIGRERKLFLTEKGTRFKKVCSEYVRMVVCDE